MFSAGRAGFNGARDGSRDRGRSESRRSRTSSGFNGARDGSRDRERNRRSCRRLARCFNGARDGSRDRALAQRESRAPFRRFNGARDGSRDRVARELKAFIRSIASMGPAMVRGIENNRSRNQRPLRHASMGPAMVRGIEDRSSSCAAPSAQGFNGARDGSRDRGGRSGYVGLYLATLQWGPRWFAG